MAAEHHPSYDFLFAEHDIPEDDTICYLNSGSAEESDPRRIQVDQNTFILPPKSIYHSCSPNGHIDWSDLALKACWPISKGEAITYHYGTSELDYDIGAFHCECGLEEGCLGYFRGFKYMMPQQQAKILPMASPYISSWFLSNI
jgi:SET domain-containing protein